MDKDEIITESIDLEPIKDESLAERDYGTTGISPLLFK